MSNSGVSALIAAPPKDTPFVDPKTGRLSLPWLAWLGSITATGAVVAQLVTNIAGALLAANNLADLPDKALARTNLGLGSAATHAASDFDVAGAAAAVLVSSLQIAANLSDLANAVAARTNLGLGTAATHASADFDASGLAAAAQAAAIAASCQRASNLSDVASAAAARTNLGLGTAATQASTAFDPAGAWSSWAGDVAANAHNLSNVGILAAAGVQVGAFLAFSGSMYYQPGAATYFTGPNAGAGAWNEYGYYLQPGASLALDEFWISVNARSALGGADSYLPALKVRALTGAVAFPNTVTFTDAPVFSDAPGTRAALGLAASATTDTTNAANISSGTLPAARLPNPSSSTLGGVQSAAAVSHQFVASISTSGVPALAQPAFSDISGTAAAGQIPTLNQNTTGTAANVTGTVAVGNGGTGQTTAGAALTALGGAALSGGNAFSGNQTTSSGSKVGVGNTSPYAILDILGTQDAGPTTTYKGILQVASNSNVGLEIGTYSASPYGAWVQVQDSRQLNNGTYPLILQPTGGKVGIGTTNPSDPLQVNGALNATSYKVGGTAGATGTFNRTFAVRLV